jgi:hypothetical protein
MFQTLAWLSAQIRGAQVSAKIATKSNLRRSWYDYNWDWALILLLAFVLLAGIVVLWTYADHPQTAAAVDLLALSWGSLMTTVLVVYPA